MNQTENESDTLTGAPVVLEAPSEPQTFPCQYDGCDKGPFDSEQALRMHVVRMHTHREQSSRASGLSSRQRAAKKAKGTTAIGSEEHRRKMSRVMRAVWAKKMGKRPNRAADQKKESYLRLRDRNWKLGLTAKGKPRRAFVRPMKKSAPTKQADALTRHFAWPLPETPAIKEAPLIKYCPHCGTNIERYLT